MKEIATERKRGQSYRLPRGTADILPQEQPYWRYVQDTAATLVETFGYQRIDTPVFEESGLFVRSIGEVTDIVQKETYTLQDRSGDSITLRPEGTAPVCRAYLEHGMHNLPQPVRLYYFCPIFRYERPQAGRLRQHHQFGLEALGDADAFVDAEVVEVGWRLLESMGLKDMSLLINSIGDSQCRPGYLAKLKEHYYRHIDDVCAECKNRLERNPMRLLDCKQASCQRTVSGAPHSTDYLCEACQAHWDSLLAYLEVLGLPYRIDHRLVRGFDYYTRTVFEIQPPVEGAMATVLGGGRYDGLIEELGGRPTPGVGFGSGLERIILNLKRQGGLVPDTRGIDVVATYQGVEAKREAIRVASELRKNSRHAVVAPDKSLKAQMRFASASGAPFSIIVMPEELSRGKVVVRDMRRGQQWEVSPGDVGDVLSQVEEGGAE